MCDIDYVIEQVQISEIQCPTLIVHRKNDNNVSFDHAEYANKKIKDSKLIGLDNEWGDIFFGLEMLLVQMFSIYFLFCQ